MQRFLHLIAAAACTFSLQTTVAQLNPTISGDDMLCPNGTTDLTTEEWDTYQWYVRIYGSATTDLIPGATNQTLTIDYANYAATYLSVVVTSGAETDTSAEFFVDGWMFPGMTVMSDGEFTVGPNGVAMLCPGDTMYFHVNGPYGTNTQWYEGGNPIPGATSPTLMVTEMGVYEVLSAPGVCPDMLSSPGVALEVDQWAFIGMTVMSGGDFEIGPNGESIICEGESMYFQSMDPYTTNVQWYEGGVPIPGANATVLNVTEAGVYDVEAAPEQCPDLLSSPGVSLVVLVENCSPAGLDETAIEPAQLFPNPATTQLTISNPAHIMRHVTIVDQLGQQVSAATPDAFGVTIATAQLPAGCYFVRIAYDAGSETRYFIVH